MFSKCGTQLEMLTNTTKVLIFVIARNVYEIAMQFKFFVQGTTVHKFCGFISTSIATGINKTYEMFAGLKNSGRNWFKLYLPYETRPIFSKSNNNKLIMCWK